VDLAIDPDRNRARAEHQFDGRTIISIVFSSWRRAVGDNCSTLQPIVARQSLVVNGCSIAGLLPSIKPHAKTRRREGEFVDLAIDPDRNRA